MSTRGNQRRIDPEVIRQQRARMLMRLGRVVATLVVVASLAGGGYWMNQRLSVTHWQVEGDSLLQQAIREQLEQMENHDYLHTRPELLAQAWRARLPDIASVDIRRQLPDGLWVHVEARVPMALWQDAQSRVHLFDDQGDIYRPLKKDESPDLPLLRVASDRLADAHQLMQLLQNQRVVAPASLSEVQAGDGYWKLYFARGVMWVLPFGEEQSAITEISKLMNEPRWKSRAWRIDARSSSRWYVRPARQGGVI